MPNFKLIYLGKIVPFFPGVSPKSGRVGKVVVVRSGTENDQTNTVDEEMVKLQVRAYLELHRASDQRSESVRITLIPIIGLE